jgi:hypothetical protein
MTATICNACRQQTLSLYDSSGGLKTYRCSNVGCGQIIQFINNGGGWQLAVAGIGFASGAATLLQFFGVGSVSALLDLFDS